jgi:sugar phosphate isomerase/epimerase
MIALGGPVFEPYITPAEWVKAVRQHGYSAALCPVPLDESNSQTIRAYADAAQQSGIIIAEVGAWSNPLSRDEATRHAAIDQCRRALALADELGAACCVNIAGSLGEKWDGPCAADLTATTFDLIVESVRYIIDAVKPVGTFYTLEPMPWMYPDSPDSYLKLIKAIDRPAFAVHLDPINMINSPRRYFQQQAFIKECFDKLGPYIKACHIKDIILRDNLTVHLDEVRPGLGHFDHAYFLRRLNALNGRIPLLVEHLSTPEAYSLAADHIRAVARQEGITL